MRITMYQEKAAKKDSVASFVLEGAAGKDGFAQMLRDGSTNSMRAVWDISGNRRSFTKIGLHTYELQNSIRLLEQETRKFIGRIEDISWNNLTAEPSGSDHIDFKLKGQTDLGQNQLLALQLCLREHIVLEVEWYEVQPELPLKGKKKDDSVEELMGGISSITLSTINGTVTATPKEMQAALDILEKDGQPDASEEMN